MYADDIISSLKNNLIEYLMYYVFNCLDMVCEWSAEHCLSVQTEKEEIMISNKYITGGLIYKQRDLLPFNYTETFGVIIDKDLN